MGTILKIKGADFGEHVLSKFMQLEQGGINVRVGDSANYGKNTTGPGNSYVIRSINNIFLKSKECITILGLKGINGDKGALHIDWCAYSTDDRTTENVITTASKGNSDLYYYINKNEKLANVKIINDTGQDAYFGFIFNCDDNELLSSDYSPLRYSIMHIV